MARVKVVWLLSTCFPGFIGGVACRIFLYHYRAKTKNKLNDSSVRSVIS